MHKCNIVVKSYYKIKTYPHNQQTLLLRLLN